MASQTVTLRDAPKKPHAYVNGLSLPFKFALPNLELVREEAATILQMMHSPRESIAATAATPEGQIMAVHRGLVYHIKYPHIFGFARYCEPEEGQKFFRSSDQRLMTTDQSPMIYFLNAYGPGNARCLVENGADGVDDDDDQVAQPANADRRTPAGPRSLPRLPSSTSLMTAS
ncbi:hypothetical protein BD626DRAFT_569046 [Schizophyllum amplum]|uniref:Uncharacterized protein n=1 Tax=Schizophyllum amplum TaxID=97359 RepID=A0A550CFT4_9AGAR|nr:hypothetical protein BD626DRAFT_569046 [Auriculariopsis ampla]